MNKLNKKQLDNITPLFTKFTKDTPDISMSPSEISVVYTVIDWCSKNIKDLQVLQVLNK